MIINISQFTQSNLAANAWKQKRILSFFRNEKMVLIKLCYLYYKVFRLMCSGMLLKTKSFTDTLKCFYRIGKSEMLLKIASCIIIYEPIILLLFLLLSLLLCSVNCLSIAICKQKFCNIFLL